MRSINLKKLFYLLFTIAFFIPIFITLFYNFSSPFLKVLFLNIYPKMNIIYYGFLILFLFLSFNKKYSNFAVNTGILYIVLFYLYLGVFYYLIPYFKAKNIAKKEHAIFTTADNLAKIKDYKLLYKNSVFVVIKKAKYDHTNPFNYIKQRNQ
jgi:hypothetical protein